MAASAARGVKKHQPPGGRSAAELVQSVKDMLEQSERTRRWVEVGANGEIVLPEQMRRQLGIEPGTRVLLELDDDEVRVLTRETSVKRMQEQLRPSLEGKPSMVDELLAERRREAEQE